MPKILYIGIDPDCAKSGFAEYCPRQKKLLRLVCLDLFALIDELTKLKKEHELTVRIEAGWLKKGTWHRGGTGMAKKVGANHEIGRQIAKFCEKQAITCALVEPQGYSAWKHAYFCQVTGWPVKQLTNSETRVAGMMVWGM